MHCVSLPQRVDTPLCALRRAHRPAVPRRPCRPSAARRPDSVDEVARRYARAETTADRARAADVHATAHGEAAHEAERAGPPDSRPYAVLAASDAAARAYAACGRGDA